MTIQQSALYYVLKKTKQWLNILYYKKTSSFLHQNTRLFYQQKKNWQR